MMRIVLRGLLLLLAGMAAARGQSPAPDAIEPEIVRIAVHGAGAWGGDVAMVTQVFRPAGAGPFPVIVYSHGRATSEADRGKLDAPVLRGHVRYWLKKGFAVVAPIRPGYGETGGADREASGARYDAFGNCTGSPDFAKPAHNAAAAVLAAVDWVRAQAWANPDRIILEGQSMGGLTTIAVAAANPPGVVGYINFAGGAGGDPARAPGRSCGAKEMEALVAQYGKTTRVPNLWLYAENDGYWGSESPRAWHAAFSAGGSVTHLVVTPPVENADGHQLLARGGKLWSVHTDRFAQELGF